MRITDATEAAKTLNEQFVGMKVIIIGGGIGGLCLANGLHRNGVDVKLFERQTSPSESLAGYGIHINAHGRRALQQCLDPSDWNRFLALSTPAGTTMSFRDTQFRLLAERDDAQLSGRSPADVERRGIGRIELRKLLLKRLDKPDQSIVHWGKMFSHYDRLQDRRVRVHFEDGSMEEADLLIGADGCHSKVRQQYLPDIQRQDLGIMAIAGRYILDKTRMKGLPNAFTDGSLNNIVPHGKGWMFLTSWYSQSLTQTSEDPEQHIMWAYVVPKSDMPANAKEMGAGELRDLALSGTRAWSSILQHFVEGADLTTVVPVWLKTMPRLKEWKSSAVTVIGDAIHNMTPMAGIGANTALRDAALLTDLLSEAVNHDTSVVQAVNTYETSMREYANAAIELSRRNAEAASSSGVLQREAFRIILRLAQASPPVMRKTIGKSVVNEQLSQAKLSV